MTPNVLFAKKKIDMAKTLFDSLFATVANVETKNVTKSNNSVYRKEIFANANTVDETKKIRRNLRKKLDTKYTDFVIIAKSHNENLIKDFAKDFAKYYKETYATNDYTLESLTSKLEFKTSTWKNVMQTLLLLAKDIETQSISKPKKARARAKKVAETETQKAKENASK